MLIFLACVRWPIGPLRSIKHFADGVVRPLFAGCTVVELGALSLAAGVGEEMLFRGLLQAALARRLGIAAGLVLASILFGLMHPITPAYVVMAGLVGAFLGWLCLATGNLLAPIVTHAAYDWAALVYLLQANRRNSSSV